MKQIWINDGAYNILKSHKYEFQESFAEAVDELISVRDSAWVPTKLNPGQKGDSNGKT